MPPLLRSPALLLLLAAGSAAPAAEPLATRQTAFSIPYRIDAAGNSAEHPVEVQLYVSTDRGAAWKLHSKVPPDQGRFAFKAEKDGEYWFLVRTKDNTGRVLPQKPSAPELQVLVDTAEPALELNAARGQAGEVTIRWRATDPNLQPQNLKLDYQTKGAADLWQSIAIDPRRTQVAAGNCQGEVTLWTRAIGEPLVIRAEITDRAGNLAVTQTEVEAGKKPDAAPVTPASPAGDTAQPVYPDTAVPSSGQGSSPPNNEKPIVPVTPPPAAAKENPPPAESKPGLVSVFPALGFRWPADQARKPLARSAAESAPITPFVVQKLPVRPPTAPEAAATASDAPATEAPWVQPPLKEIQRPADRRLSDPVAAISAVSSAVAAGYQPPPGVRPRMVNSRSFQLEYDLGTSVPGGVRKVELWGTRDGGQRWSTYGADSDNQSPMTVTVEGEGMYGFRMLVQNGAGQIEFPPQRGERPDTWVNVDLKRPTCRLTQAQQQKLEQVEQLHVAWEAHDEWLAERPISLSYSQQPIGPWLPIATGLDNTGRYTWLLDNRVPERIYLRLEARDQAGNVEVFQSPEPVILTRQAPPSRIREVRPSFQTGQGPQRYRFW